MDKEKIVSVAVGLLLVLSVAGGYMINSAKEYVDNLSKEVPVLKRRADDIEKKYKYLESKIDNKGEGVAQVLQAIQQLLSKHESKLAVIEEKIIRTDSDVQSIVGDIKEMSRDQKSVLKSILTIEAQLNTFEVTE